MIESFEVIADVIEIAGVLLLVVGIVLSAGRFVYGAFWGSGALSAYHGLRRDLGRTLLLTLELLIAADIILTIAIDKTLESLTILGLLVVIRTFLSFSLEVEVSGQWPWQGHDNKIKPTE